MNIQEIIDDSSNFLKGKGIKSSSLDSEILLASVLKKSRKYVIVNQKKNLSDSKIEDYKKLIYKRSKGEPIAYLIKKKYFWNHDFFVTKNVLIPRPDTELIISEVLKLTKHKKNLSILDIGVGTGCILLTLLKEKTAFRGTGIDISKKCIDTSKINAKKLKILGKVKLIKTNVDNFIQGKYDIIISNPPYIKKHLINYLEKDIVSFEPRSALDGGLDGLSEINRVINATSKLIKKNGKLILEIAFDQTRLVKNLLIKNGFFINRVLKDYSNNDRCIISTKID